jgi:hypothetical protein
VAFVSVARVHPGSFGLPFVLIIAAVNVIPILGWVLIRKGTIRAAWLILLPLGVALVVGLYGHFLHFGPDNVFLIPPSTFALSFRLSAVILIIIQILGCSLCSRILWSR